MSFMRAASEAAIPRAAAQSALPSSTILVTLEENDGQSMQSMQVWMSKSMTMAQVLKDWTPEDLKDANNLVVVVNGGDTTRDMVLGSIPTNGGSYHMTIRPAVPWYYI